MCRSTGVTSMRAPFAARLRVGPLLVLAGVLLVSACQSGSDGAGGRTEPAAGALTVPPDSPAVAASAAQDTTHALTSPPAPAMSDKFDAPLRMKLREVEAAGSDDAVVSVFVELPGAPTAEQRTALEQAGLDVQTVAGRVVTARGTSAAVHRVASLDFVTSVSLSQTRPPLR